MKTNLSVILIALGAVAMVPNVSAQRYGGHGGYGGQGQGAGRGMSMPSGARFGGGSVGSGAGYGISRPSGNVGSFRPPMTSMPQRAPMTSVPRRAPMAAVPQRAPMTSIPQRGPVSRPYVGGLQPHEMPIYRPALRPQAMPRSSGPIPNSRATAGVPNRPDFQRPPGNQLPRPVRPTIPSGVAGVGNRGNATLPVNRPDRPGTGAPRLVRPDGGRLPTRPVQPGQIAGASQRGPNDALRVRPPGNQIPGRTVAVGGGQFNADQRPGTVRPARPTRPANLQNLELNNANQWNRWRQDNGARIANFQNNRTRAWNNIDSSFRERAWAGRFGNDGFRHWRKNVWDFRRNRAEEIWCHRNKFWNGIFDNHWWNSCWWRPSTVVWINTSPWWCWQPCTWGSIGTFFGSTIAADPVVYDPGTTVIYEGDTYYVDGVPAGSAVEARRAAAGLASPPVEQVPVPTPPAEGQTQDWLPMGVWALTQQEQGDATMFMQFSIDKNGILAGAYKNVMTGDEQPIVGQLDKETQRVAWHIGNATQTTYETGLPNFENDVVSVFVHYGDVETQTWLLVRLSSPEMPPSTVKLPDLDKE